MIGDNEERRTVVGVDVGNVGADLGLLLSFSHTTTQKENRRINNKYAHT